MKAYIEDRTREIANYMLETGCTIRDAAKKFHISKATVHRDMSERLPKVNPQLSEKIEELMGYHISIRHIKGGLSTRKKYRNENY